MRRLAVAAVCLLPLASGCVKEITSEERLERELSSGPTGKEITEEQLRKTSCQDAPSQLAQARNDSRPETDRLMAYVELYDSLRKKVALFEEAMTRNPDLHYTERSQDFVAAHDLCVQEAADVKVEFESYLRELVNVPTVQELKGGNTITVARLDFNTLRQAIEVLGPDDKDALLNRVNAAEKRITPGGEAVAPSSSSTSSGSSSRRRRGGGER